MDPQEMVVLTDLMQKSRQQAATLTNMEKWLEKLVKPERPYLFMYPGNGTYATIAGGTTTIDFGSGAVTSPAGAVTHMERNLRAHSNGVCRSLFFDCDTTAIVQLDNNDPILVYANRGLRLNEHEFRIVEITTGGAAQMFIAASTSAHLDMDSIACGVGNSNIMVYGSLVDADGAANYFETDQPIGTTPTLFFVLTPSTVRRFRLTSVRFYMNPANAVTYELYLLEAATADDVYNLSDVVFDSDALKADSVAYSYTGSNSTKLPTDVYLHSPPYLYYMIDWSAAPGDTSGYIEVRGELMT